ncbi:TPA: hypothetical protein ACOBSI_001950, partial [Enterococcus faecium]
LNNRLFSKPFFFFLGFLVNQNHITAPAITPKSKRHTVANNIIRKLRVDKIRNNQEKRNTTPHFTKKHTSFFSVKKIFLRTKNVRVIIKEIDGSILIYNIAVSIHSLPFLF